MKRVLRSFVIVVVPMVAFLANLASAQTILRVDGLDGSPTTASPAPDGSAFGLSAYLYLQDAIAVAVADDPALNNQYQIWVLGSESGVVYHPDEDSATGSPHGVRASSFEMHPWIKVYGGFSSDSTTLADRRPHSLLTILSAEIGNTSVITDNSYHVVTADDTDINIDNCWLDGFTITRGNAEDENGGLGGGGSENDTDDSATIAACIDSALAQNLTGEAFVDAFLACLEEHGIIDP